MSERVDRRLQACGVASRREAERLVRAGRVTLDGEVVRDPAARWDPSRALALDGREMRVPPVLVAWHKPAGVLTALRDPWGRDGLDEALPEAIRDGWHPVGRLDLDTRGLLLLSRDGAWTQRLLHPRRAVEREYVARVEGAPAPDLGDRLAAGVETADGVYPAQLVAVDGDLVRLIVREGKHRMVRRLLANLGLPVLDLQRVRYGVVELGELAEGAWREVTDAELTALWPAGPRGA